VSLNAAENEILIYLLSNQWKNFSEIRQNTSLGQYALNTALNSIDKLGLVEERRGDRNSREFNLTAKGRDVAEAVKALQEMLRQA